MTNSRATQKLQLAALDGDEAGVRAALLTGADPTADDSQALHEAAFNGHIDIVKILLPVSNPKARSSWAMVRAAGEGHLDIVKLLLPVSNPKAADSYALGAAAFHGHRAIVELLLPVSDPKADDSGALRWAAIHRHDECAQLLLPHSDAGRALKRLMTEGKDEAAGRLDALVQANGLMAKHARPDGYLRTHSLAL